jgi:FG-GAP-like repeat
VKTTNAAASIAGLFHNAVTRSVARRQGIRIFIFLLAIISGVVPAAIEAAALPVFAPRELVLQLDAGGVGVFLVGAADFTGDGLIDVVLARATFQSATVHPLVILANDGTGHFVDATATVFVGPPPVVQHPREMVIADFNGDGRPDIFIADHGQDVSPFPGFQNQLALSTPDGRLINATANLPQQFDYTHSVAVGDIDGDGDLDLYIGNLGNNGGGPQLWLNDGTGHFTVGTGRLPSLNQNCTTVSPLCHRYTTALFVDVDGDGDLDLVLGGEQHTESSVLLNDGTGRFTFHPKVAAVPAKPFSAESQAIAVDIQSTDLNGDGFADLVIAYTKNVPFYQGRWIQILINNGDGTFRDETATRLPQTDNNDDWIKFLEFRDLNGDGYLDLASRCVEGTSRSAPFYLNDGNGVFTPLPPGFGNITNNLYVFLDADGDGGRDIFNTSPSSSIERHFIVRDTSPVIAPATPTDVLLANKGRLTWSYVWGATSYEVWRSTSPGSAGTLIGTTRLTTFDDASAPQGATMYYSIRAVNGAGASANSSQVPLAKALVAAVLPSSRSVQVGHPASAFGTLINIGPTTLRNCRPAPAGISAPFTYQTTDPATNGLTGTPNTPVDIPAISAQSFVFAITPTDATPPTDVAMSFRCDDVLPAPVERGLNTLLLSASATPVPDIVALGATLSNDGIVNIPGTNGTGAFAVATVNVGASGSITASADTGSASLPVNISLCQTDPATGQCISAIGPTVTTTINANATPTFGIFVQGNGTVPFDPAANRIFVRFKDSGDVTRGSTSVAVRTQ